MGKGISVNKYRNIDMTKEISDANSFIIEGYSLIAECFYGHRVDWSCGGQYLHFITILERHIALLESLSEFYFVVFFRDIGAALLSDDTKNEHEEESENEDAGKI